MAVLLLITGAVFWPMMSHQFTNWDDEAYVVNNTLLRGPDWAGIFTRPVVSNYHPLTVLSLAFNYAVSRLNPVSYLFVNWLLHLINTGLVFYFIWLITGRQRWVALFTAAVFALHPMHVESVVWVSERKDVLYTAFYLAGLIRYWRYLSNHERREYWWSFAFFIAALLAKPAAVVMPLSLLALDYWKGRHWDRTVWLEKIPFLVLSLLFGIVTIMIQSEKALVALEKYSLVDRLFFGCYGLVTYAVRFILPWPLSPFHPYPTAGSWGWGMRLAPLLLLAGVGVVWYFRQNRALVFGALFYAVNIILVVQFVAIGNTLLSERYTYVPYLGLAFASAMLLTRLKKPEFRWGILAGVVVYLAVQAYRYIPDWKNTESLWTAAINRYPGTPIPHANRANFRYLEALKPANAGKSQELLRVALADCDSAIATQPEMFAALDIRSLIYLQTRRNNEALADAEAMVRLKPDNRKGYLNRGSAYEHLGRFDDALADYSKCLELDPDNADALNGRGTVLFNGKQQYREALADFDRAVALQPNAAVYYLNRSRCYLLLGDTAKARTEAQTARAKGAVVSKDYMDLLRSKQ